MVEQKFILTEFHLRLLKRMYVRWDHIYSGAPYIDCKRPYGNGNVLEDIAEILEIEMEHDDDWEIVIKRDPNNILEGIDLKDGNDVEKRLQEIHEETKIALQIVLCTQSFEPGVYEKQCSYDSLSWKLTK